MVLIILTTITSIINDKLLKMEFLIFFLTFKFTFVIIYVYTTILYYYVKKYKHELFVVIFNILNN